MSDAIRFTYQDYLDAFDKWKKASTLTEKEVLWKRYCFIRDALNLRPVKTEKIKRKKEPDAGDFYTDDETG